MELARANDYLVLLCQACRGLLVQSQVLAKVIEERRKGYTGPDAQPRPFNPLDLEVKIDCPGCQRKMDVHPYHGPGNSVIDSCGRCGFTFLDYGELSAIERAPGQRQ